MMEWVPGTWYELFDASVDRGPTDRRQQGPSVPPSTGADSPDLDTWLIALVYSAIAAGSTCETCGSRFVRKLRVLPQPASAQRARRLLVVAKCRSWRRHVHVTSVVINEGDDMRLRPLRAVRRGVGPVT